MELRSDDDARYLFDYDAADRLRTKSRPDRIERQPRRLLVRNSQIIEANDRYGANLVRLNADYSMLDKELVKPDLDQESDWETIRAHELVGMQGSPEKLGTRLSRYFETGVWWDEQKTFLFRGIRLPEPEPGFTPCNGKTR